MSSAKDSLVNNETSEGYESVAIIAVLLPSRLPMKVEKSPAARPLSQSISRLMSTGSVSMSAESN
jgi:hypothetical protein